MTKAQTSQQEGRRIDRLDQYARVKNLNDNRITQDCGLSVGTLGKSRKPGKDLSVRTIQLILEKYQDINTNWFMTGEGDMFTPGKSADFPLYPLIDTTLADCGPSVGLSEAVANASDLPRIAIPGIPRDTEFFIQASGHSMINRENPDLSIPPGSMVGLARVNAGIIRWGEAYALVTPDGVMLKRVLPDGNGQERVKCVSYNSTEFPEFTLSRDEIIDIARITCVVPVMVR